MTAPTDTREAVERATRRRLRRESRSRWLRFGLIALAVLVLDQGVKALARATMALGGTVHVLPGVTLHRIDNEGIAFGLLTDRQGAVAFVTMGAMCAIGLVLAAVGGRHPAVPIGGGLLVGGSVGNLIDRIRFGAVTDFLKMPLANNYFNVADVAITAGALLIAWGLWRAGGEDGDERPSA